ncbi:2-oxo acid dehydrogenase subunit E2 [Evansella sp. LMS18]|jgi:pyruvate dehydrogenase E2 component (dihydrolipoamide acetyltransferase)|uniref:dihydrolipoamide acetyltransferase family protein n=1 Tax=Evansella sp. LMS18 TaxID=2924033 RepID=UPI0020D01BCC|nr:dihydrolipoamide acetyltransferase family protein [Evansella sp. LMS18]UTR10399.1 2-oxo acid dehydrogenase subunit E2 [Evansella sp. LMS18]
MSKAIVMPKMGMGMKEGTVVLWHKEEGETVEKGEPVVSVSSDKIENEIESPVDGTLIKAMVDVDEVVPVGQPIAYVGEPGERIEEEARSAGAGNEGGNSVEAENTDSNEYVAASLATMDPPTPEKTEAPGRGRKRVSPAARKLAKQKSVDLETVIGTGPQGRITKADIIKAAEQTAEPANTEEVPKPTEVKLRIRKPEEDKNSNVREYTGVRRIIGKRMHESLQNTAQLTIMKSVDVTELMNLQKKLRVEMGNLEVEGKITVTDLLAKAVTLALLKHPFMNSALQDERIEEYEHVHLGIAAANDRGLVVPVVFNAEKETLIGLSRQIGELGRKAKEGLLTSDEIKGSTFTITNLGASGVSYFTPVLNPPETGILGVGSIEEQAVFKDGEPVPVKKLPLSLSFDHRVTDGEPASRFLNTVAAYLENPYMLLASDR